jgi:hypothetical protein
MKNKKLTKNTTPNFNDKQKFKKNEKNTNKEGISDSINDVNQKKSFGNSFLNYCFSYIILTLIIILFVICSNSLIFITPELENEELYEQTHSIFFITNLTWNSDDSYYGYLRFFMNNFNLIRFLILWGMIFIISNIILSNTMKLEYKLISGFEITFFTILIVDNSPFIRILNLILVQLEFVIFILIIWIVNFYFQEKKKITQTKIEKNEKSNKF